MNFLSCNVLLIRLRIIMQFWAQRVSIPKCFSTGLFHGHAARIDSPHHPCRASTTWFIKIVCTLCIRHSQSLSVFDSCYFRENLNPYIAFGVVYHLNSRLNNPDLAFSFFRISRVSLNLIHLESTFDFLLSSLCGMGFYDSAKVVYDYMKADGVSLNSTVLDFAVSSFAKVGKFRIAEEILIAKAEFCIVRGEVVSTFVYNDFLSILINRDQVDEAVLLFRNHLLRLRSFCPDAWSFNIVLRGLCRVGKIGEAFEFFNVMSNFHCNPDLVTYNTLMNGLCRVGKVDRAEKLLREVIQCGQSPDVVTYTSIISGYCKLGKVENAETLLDEMFRNGVKPNLVTFNVIIDGFGKRGEVASAMRMYEKMAMAGLQPDVVTYTSLLDGHCRCGELEQGFKFWNEMNQRKVLPNVFTFSVLISSLCKENRLHEARDLLRQLSLRKDIIPRPFIYNPVIDGLCKAGNVDEANAIITEMEAKGCVHDKMTFTILILGHCMKGRMFDAIQIYDKMLAVGCAPDNITTRSLISCLRKAGMAREANQIEQRTLNGAQSNSSQSGKTMQDKAKMNITVAA